MHFCARIGGNGITFSVQGCVSSAICLRIAHPLAPYSGSAVNGYFGRCWHGCCNLRLMLFSLTKISYHEIFLTLLFYRLCIFLQYSDEQKPAKSNSTPTGTKCPPTKKTSYFWATASLQFAWIPNKLFLRWYKTNRLIKITVHGVNAGVSGETTSGGLSRIDWIYGKA